MCVTSDRSEQHKSARPAFTLVELLVVIAIIGVLVALLLPAVQAAREAARRAQCQNNMRQVALALINHHDVLGVFPEAADGYKENRPGYLARLLPYIEGGNIESQIDYDKLFNRDVNQPIAQLAFTMFQCPSLADEELVDLYWRRIDGIDYETSSYAAIAGAGRALAPDSDGEPLSPTNNCGRPGGDGIIYANSQVNMRQITDGTSNTFAIGERNYELRAWMRGPVSGGACTSNTKTLRNPIVNNIDGFGDWYVADNSGRQSGTLGFSNLPFGSNHPAGAHFVKADGSVDFFEEGANLCLLMNLSTIAGGETAAECLPDEGATPPPPPPSDQR